MYAYKVVETALARLHVVSPATMGVFRGRIKHLQRIGLVPSSPGPGKRITYSFEDVAKWALALEIAEFGIDPLIIRQLVLSVWDKGLLRHIENGQYHLLIIRPNAVTHPDSWYTMAPMQKDASQFNPDFYQTKRTMVINVSMMGREVKQALADAESGALDGFLREIDEAMRRVREADAVNAYISAALKTATPGSARAVGGVNGGPLVQEKVPGGEWRELKPAPRKGKRSATDPAPTADSTPSDPAETTAERSANNPRDPFERGPRLMLDLPEPVPVDMPKRGPRNMKI